MASRHEGRTVRDFQSTADVWGIADGWAASQGYKLAAQDENSRMYQRGTGFWVAPQRVMLTWTGQGYHLEAWVYLPVFNRIMTLWLMPEEIKIDSSGFVAVIPRNRARADVNALLATLGGEPIQ